MTARAEQRVFVGIDVAKDEVAIAIAPSGEQWTSPTSGKGLEQAVAQSQAHALALVVLEATGGLEAALVALLAEAGLPWSSSIRVRYATSQNRWGA